MCESVNQTPDGDGKIMEDSPSILICMESFDVNLKSPLLPSSQSDWRLDKMLVTGPVMERNELYGLSTRTESCFPISMTLLFMTTGIYFLARQENGLSAL